MAAFDRTAGFESAAGVCRVGHEKLVSHGLTRSQVIHHCARLATPIAIRSSCTAILRFLRPLPSIVRNGRYLAESGLTKGVISKATLDTASEPSIHAWKNQSVNIGRAPARVAQGPKGMDSSLTA